MYQLSRHLFYVNPHALHAAAGAFQDGVHFFDGRVVLEANEASHAQGFFFVLDNLCAAKDDDALDVVRPVAIFFIVFVKNSKAYFAALFYGVNLMTFFGTMEIEGIFFFIIDVVDGNAIGIAVITDDRKDASSAVFEDLLTGIKGESLFEAAHGSNHGNHLLFGYSLPVYHGTSPSFILF